MDKIDVVVLAGAPAGVELDPEGKLGSRAMVEISGKSMLDWVVDALKASSSIGKIAVVGKVECSNVDKIIEPGPSLVDNIKLGLEELDSIGHVLIVSSDIPMLTAESVEDFISKAKSCNVDFAYPVVTKEKCLEQYPGLARTYLKTADGVFTGGNLMLVNPDFIRNNWQVIAEVYNARKRIFDLARIIGIGTLIRVVIGQIVPGFLKLKMLEDAASRMLGGASLKAVVVDYAEIGEDVDKPEDVEAVRGILAESKN